MQTKTNITLPEIMCRDNIEDILKVCKSIRTKENITLDAHKYRFASPIGLALLKAAIHSRHPCRVDDIVWLAKNSASYLQRMDFFSGIDAPSVEMPNYRRNDCSDRLIEIFQLSHEGMVEDLSKRITDALAESIKRSVLTTEYDWSAACKHISYLISELLLNATTHAKRGQHSQRSAAWVCAQARGPQAHQPAEIEIAIVDDGCGVLYTLADQIDNKTSHPEAIQKAMQPLVSCNLGVDFDGRETANQGVGLYVAHDMIERAGGSMLMVSGDGIYRPGATKRKDNFQTIEQSWEGVAISLRIPFDRLHLIKPGESLDKIRHLIDSEPELNFC